MCAEYRNCNLTAKVFNAGFELSAGKTPYDLMRATFPAGTVSGAPRIRATQIIADLEGTTRGPYGGCVGYFSRWWGERPREPARQ
jgi:isochorismate synthase EntC